MQVALGRALRKDGQIDEAMAGLRARGGRSCPSQAATTVRTSSWPRWRSRRRIVRARSPSSTALVAVDFNNVEAARQLAQLMRQEHVDDPAKLRPVYQRIAAIDPFDADAHTMLGRFALQRNEADEASREFRAVIALGPVDRAAAYTDLAESYFKAGKRAEAKKQTLAALEIAPSYERAQGLLLKLVDR